MKNKFTIGVFGIIKDENNNVLLVLRNDSNLWTLPGGGLKEGESPWQGVIREIKEETGYDVEVIRLIGVYSKPKKNEIVLLFKCKIIGGKMRLNEEAKDIRYFSPKEIPENTIPKQAERIKDSSKDNYEATMKVQ